MSEDVIRTVSQFTPAAVDRDTLLFQAGRASARTPMAWKAVAGLLLLSQAVTLVALWPHDERRGSPPPDDSPTASVPVAMDAPPPDPSAYVSLIHVADWEKQAPSGGGEPRRSSEPPLTVRSLDIE